MKKYFKTKEDYIAFADSEIERTKREYFYKLFILATDKEDFVSRAKRDFPTFSQEEIEKAYKDNSNILIRVRNKKTKEKTKCN
ncbi:hypothetical protein [Konateibacter massiliensis]|uniref:hypothetical protein n=1 Tax=Konateibacter massiliensis TaxID=2002841 RepID=UPI00117B3F23|nr:hypothetical protein [Konateibacter massiliensis]